jgi:hypothetical protein
MLLDKPVADDMLLGSLARALSLAECSQGLGAT